MQHSVGQTSQVYDGGDYTSSIGEPVHTTHTYVLKTDYAFISIKSRAQKSHDIPLMYLEEETVGAVVFPECHLHEIRSIIVVVSQFLDRVIAIKSGCCSCKSSSLTLLSTHLRQGSCCHPRKFAVPIPQTENFVGTLPSRQRPHHALSHPQSKPTMLPSAPQYEIKIAIRISSYNSRSIVVDCSCERSSSRSPP